MATNPNPNGPEGENNTEQQQAGAGSDEQQQQQQQEDRFKSVPDEWKWLADEAKDARAEAAKRRIKNKELQEQLEKAKSIEEFEQLRNELTKSTSKLELDLAKERAARKHKLNDDVLEFLDGSTPEQIEERAAKLASLGSPKGDQEPEPKGPQKRITKVPLTGGTQPASRETAELSGAELMRNWRKSRGY